MPRAKKLTPAILKRLISEEKAKLQQKTDVDKELTEFVKLTLQEAKMLVRARKLRARRTAIKSKLKRR